MKSRVLSLAMAASALALLVSACGSGGTTTVVKEAAPETVERTVTEQAPAPKPKPVKHPNPEPAPEPEPEPEPESAEPPNVIGLPLPDAKAMLKEAGYKTAAKNTDTTFGIIVPSHYTICTQSKPRGDLVVVLAQKYGC